MSESAFSAHLALERHCSTYGNPLRIICDNGGNFKGISLDMKQQQDFVDEMLGYMKWPERAPEVKFIPAYSPRFGGGYEIAVQSGRKSLARLLPLYGLLTDEQFETILKKAQAFANDRPLGLPSGDSKDFPPLTPNCLLGRGERFYHLMPVTECSEQVHHSRHMRSAYKKLWEFYYEEYVQALQKKQKAQKNPHVYRVGEVVHLITGQDIKPTAQRTYAGPVRAVMGRYHVGIIRHIKENKIDGHGRVFVVDMGRGQLKTVSSMNIAPTFFN